MKSTREQAAVGLFVLVAAGLLIGTVLLVSGTFSKSGTAHSSYFKFAGGLLPGATVRYAGVKAGRVVDVHVDPQDSTRIQIDFSVARKMPVKTDSIAKITSLGALDENYLELTAGTNGAPLAPPGSVIKSEETISIGDLGAMIGGLEPVAQQTLLSLNQRLGELKVTVARVNDLLDDQNRANVGQTLGNLKSGSGQLNSLLAENRSKVSATLTNVQEASAKFTPLLDNLQTTIAQAKDTLSHVDSLVVDNREGVHTSVEELQKTLLTASQVVEQVKSLLNYQTGNIDQTLENLRMVAVNLDQLTDEVKRRPSLLIRGNSEKERKPGAKH